jgi:hypothetical protein
MSLEQESVRVAQRQPCYTPYISPMPSHDRWHRVRVGLVVALVLIFAGVVIDSLFSASWALDDGLLLTAAAVIALALVLARGRGRAETR